MSREVSDLQVVDAGPTGIAIGAEAVERGLDVLLVDRGPLCAATGRIFIESSRAYAPKIVGQLLARLRSPVAV